MSADGFFEHEKANNDLIVALQGARLSREREAILRTGSTLLVPQNVALEGVPLSPAFVLAHAALFDPSPATPARFATLAGVVGALDAARDNVWVLGRVPVASAGDAAALLGTTGRDVAGDATRAAGAQGIVVLREGHVRLGSRSVPIILIGEPLTYEGCEWGWQRNRSADTCPPTVVPEPLVTVDALLQPPVQPGPRLFDDDKKEPSKDGKERDRPEAPRAQAASQALGPNLHLRQPRKNAFLVKLRSPEAADVARALKKYVLEFGAHRGDADAAARELHAFADALGASVMATHPLWRDCPNEAESVREGIEKYLTLSLFSQIFPPCVCAGARGGSRAPPEIEQDAKLSEKIRAHWFVTLEHLDISLVHSPEVDKQLELAVHELLKINDYKTPLDKMVILMNCCKIIFIAGAFTDLLSNQENKPAGADEFLPVLIFVVLKANPPNLFSNIQYIQRYRNPAGFGGTEMGYYFTNFVSAVTFIQSVGPAALSIDMQTYQRLVSEKPAPRALSRGSFSVEDSTGDPLASFSAEEKALTPPQASPPPSRPVTAAAAESKSRRSFSLSSSFFGMPVVASPSANWGFGGAAAGSSSDRVSVHSCDSAQAIDSDVPAGLVVGPTSGYRFAGVRYEDLRVSDVPALLAEYKELVAEVSRLQMRARQRP
eukprot:m51a1_g9108 hypothetical protein (660) ;mRNA; r:106847-109511